MKQCDWPINEIEENTHLQYLEKNQALHVFWYTA